MNQIDDKLNEIFIRISRAYIPLRPWVDSDLPPILYGYSSYLMFKIQIISLTKKIFCRVYATEGLKGLCHKKLFSEILLGF